MSVPASRFTNPATRTTYRLVLTGLRDWRITKSRDNDGRLRLVHLRGLVGTDAVDLAAVSRLVAGAVGSTTRTVVPGEMFAAVVLCDLERTADALTAIAREAHLVYEVGCRGFRPRSALLRQQRETALARVTAECLQMAEAWEASSLVAGTPLPEWLSAALADGEAQRRKLASVAAQA